MKSHKVDYVKEKQQKQFSHTPFAFTSAAVLTKKHSPALTQNVQKKYKEFIK